MHSLEAICIKLRHNRLLGQANWLWDRVRVPYNHLVDRYGVAGLPRVINGSDPILVLPRFRGVTESYEPDVWHHLMKEVRTGDCIADVGAYIGLYSVALALRVGPSGSVTAFEPDADNFAALEGHCRLNQVHERTTLINAAVSNIDGSVGFESNKGAESHISLSGSVGSHTQSVRLDSIFAGRKLDLLKVDVEGFEETALMGASQLLQDPLRRPRRIFVEVHPYAWRATGASSETLIGLLRQYDYEVTDIDGASISEVSTYGEIIARPKRCESD